MIVLLSGGLDSAVVLAQARAEAPLAPVLALSFDYGQRHQAELDAAAHLAARYNAQHVVSRFDVLAQVGGSALTDHKRTIPTTPTIGVPPTYVPARNTIFLAHALSAAEALGHDEVRLGVNAIDYSGYPDCRPEFLACFQALAVVATKAGVDGRGARVVAPLLHRTKAEIITLGARLGVPWASTVSCYQATPAGLACGRCDSCRIRRDGFAAAGLSDLTRYVSP